MRLLVGKYITFHVISFKNVDFDDDKYIFVKYSAAIGLGLYGNDDFHNGVESFVSSLRNIQAYFDFVKNQVIQMSIFHLLDLHIYDTVLDRMHEK